MNADKVIDDAIAGRLTSASFKRWTAKRKARVVRAISAAQISFDEACERFGLSAEELQSWLSAYNRAALAGNPLAGLHIKNLIAQRTPQAAGLARETFRYTPDQQFLRTFNGADA